MNGALQPGQVNPAGWYFDPNVDRTMRYWDGQAWTDRTATGYDHAAPGSVTMTAARPRAAVRQGPSFMQMNAQSMFAVGIAIAYVVIAQVAGIVLLGIVPFMATMRAFGRKEPMAPLALVASVGAVALAFMAITGPR